MFKWFGGLIDSNEKEINRLTKIVEQINKLEPEYQALSPEALRGKTAEFKERISQATADLRKELIEKRDELDEAKACLAEAVAPFDKDEQTKLCKGLEDEAAGLDKELGKAENKALSDILPEAFAAVREAARRTIGQRHYDVQLIGGIVLHQGKIAEMKTGEGKTLVATLPLYLNSLTGRGVHLVTVNDYLARRDPYWMGPVFHALGVSVASIYPMQTPDETRHPAFSTRTSIPATGHGLISKRPPVKKPIQPISFTASQASSASITSGTIWSSTWHRQSNDH